MGDWAAVGPASLQEVPSGGVRAEQRPELADIRRLARRAVTGVVSAARAAERPSLARLIADHLASDAAGWSVVEETWPGYEHVNVQCGLDAWLAGPGRDHELQGVVNFQHREFGLADMIAGADGPDAYGLRPGTVARVNLAVGPQGQVRACVRCGLYLVEEDGVRSAVLLRGPDQHGLNVVTVQVVSAEPGYASRAAVEIRAQALVENVYRGQVLSFGGQVFGHGGDSTPLQFHPREPVGADELVLPDGVLAAVERQVLGVAEHKARLLAAGQHLKRGLLLFGPPGVGKTHTLRHLISRLDGTTVVLLSGEALHLVGAACSVARSLQPAMVVVEDVDLIAEDRGMHPGNHPMLFQLLNEMDGLAEDSDVVFVLTTNRADLLEPALAARPGRIDQAVELTLPDAAARLQLFRLYQRALDVDASRLDDVIERTAGVTASFLKELVRRAALVAATVAGTGDGSPSRAPLRVRADDLDAALAELLDTRNAMTRVVLGAAAPAVPSAVPTVYRG